MSRKKKKKKLDKKLIRERLRELEAEAKNVNTKRSAQGGPATMSPKETLGEEAVESKRNESDELIIKDVKKVALAAAVMLAVFIALLFINLKTNYILQASDKIIDLLHIGQL